MFAPLGALGSFGGGAVQGYTEDLPKIYGQMGIAALGKAFQAQPGPIDQMNQQRAMAPPPGVASMPAQGPPQMGGEPPVQPSPQPAPLGGQGPPSQPASPPGTAVGGGMPLQALAARIQQANPGLLPQAMISALIHATPLLDAQGRQQLVDIRRRAYGLGTGLRTRQMDLREHELDMRERKLGGKTNPAAQPTAPSHEAVNPQTGQVIFWDQGRNAWVDKQSGQLLQGGETATP